MSSAVVIPSSPSLEKSAGIFLETSTKSHNHIDTDPTAETVHNIKWVAYSIIAYIIVSVGIVGNLLNLVVLTRPNLKRVMYVYLLGLAISNLCVLVTAIPALFDISKGLEGGDYTTAFYQAHLKLPLINSFMASSVYIIICMTVNRYISIYKPTQFQRIHTFKNARISIVASFLSGILLHIPLCFQNRVTESCVDFASTRNTTATADATAMPKAEADNQTLNCTYTSEGNEEITSSWLFKIYLVISEIFLRFGPIIILGILNALIIHRFQKIARKRQLLKGYSVNARGGGGGRRQQPRRASTPPSSPYPSGAISSTTTQISTMSTTSCTTVGHHLAVVDSGHRSSVRRKSLQSPEERVLVLVLISIVVLFVCCCTPAAILSILFSEKLKHHLGFQIFRACANNLELLNFALNFYIYCLCSAEIRRAFVSIFKNFCSKPVKSKNIDMTVKFESNQIKIEQV